MDDQHLSTGTAQRAPHPGLRALVGPYHGYHYEGLAPGVHHGIPSTELTLVVAFDEPLDVAWSGAPGTRDRHWAMVSGLHSVPALIHHSGFQHGVQLGLSPLGARRLLGVTARSLAAELVPLADVVGAAAGRLYDDLAGRVSWRERFDVLDRHLLAWAARTGRWGPGALDPPLHRAWAVLHDTGGSVRVDDLARDVGWSRRHLTSRFGAEFGLPPKQVARVLRLQRSRELMLSGGRGLADIAGACGYADQAHLTRDWQDLAGYSPTRWCTEERPFLQDHDDPR